MAEPSGAALFQLARQQLVALFDTARQALQDAGRLELGAAGPEWDGTALSGHLLAPIEDLDIPLPGAHDVLHALAGLAAAGGAAGPWQAGLHGWDPGAGQGNGIALAFRIATAPPGAPLAGALAVTPGDAGPLVSLLASGTGAIPAGSPVAISLGEEAHLLASGAVAGRLSVTFAGEGAPTVTGATPGDHVELTVVGRVPDIAAGAIALRIGSATTRVGVDVGPSGQPAFSAAASLPEAVFHLDPGPLTILLGDALDLPAPLDLAVKPGQGITLNGSLELRVPLPAPGNLGPVDVRRLDVILSGQAAQGLALQIGFDTDLEVGLDPAPLKTTLQGIGSSLRFLLGPGAAGPQLPDVGISLPRGAAIALDAGFINGGGVLIGEHGSYAGGLSLSLPPMSVSAFGSFELPDPPGHPDLSLLIVLGVRFPFPGIEIGFGFAVSGVGGIVGLNRRVDHDALTAAVLDGRLAQLLLPADPAAALPSIAASVPALFPSAPGRFLVGPMLELSWGGRLVRLVAAVVAELPAPVRFTIIGKLTVTVPDEVAPLIFIQATLAAQIDTDTPSVTVVVSLAGSNLVGMALTGDLFLLTRGGEDPEFVISAGGFHPAFRAPAGVPPLRRLGVRMRSAIVELRCDAYLAVTSGTAQFGARVEVSAELADCGLSGFFGFDALFQWDPYFHFTVGVAAGLSVEAFGETLVGIGIDITIEGPSPWHLVGHGHIETFLFDVPISIDETWGGPPPAVTTVDAGPPLLGALAAPEAWRPSVQPAALAGTKLTDEAAAGLAQGELLHPLGTVQVRESLLPLGVQVDRLGGAHLTPQTWTIAGARLRAGAPSIATVPLQDWFALGQFVDLTPDQQMSRPGYQQLDCGVTLVPGGAPPAPARPVDIAWETILIGAGVAQPQQPLPAWAGLDAVQALPLDRTFAVAHWVRPPADRVDVLAEQPVTAALSSTVAVSGTTELGGVAVDAPVGSETQARDWAKAMSVDGLTATVVETWELVA